MIKMYAYFGKQQQKENRMYYFKIETVKHGYDLESEIETMSLKDLQELADLEELPDESVRKDILEEEISIFFLPTKLNKKVTAFKIKGNTV